MRQHCCRDWGGSVPSCEVCAQPRDFMCASPQFSGCLVKFRRGSSMACRPRHEAPKVADAYLPRGSQTASRSRSLRDPRQSSQTRSFSRSGCADRERQRLRDLSPRAHETGVSRASHLRVPIFFGASLKARASAASFAGRAPHVPAAPSQGERAVRSMQDSPAACGWTLRHR